MNRYLLTIAVTLLLVLSPLSDAAENTGFKGIYIGQPESDLPKTLERQLISYRGMHGGDYFSLVLTKGTVEYFSVIYFEGTPGKAAIVKSVTLAQALKEHSLSRAEKPLLALARGRDGRAWGIVDLQNRIAFAAVPTSPTSSVTEVLYLTEHAPVLQTQPADKLTEEQASPLLAAAGAVAPSGAVAVITPEQRYTFASRELAIRELTEVSDRLIGKGKRTLALIRSMEIWLGIDENHPEAKATARQLRTYYSEFQSEFSAAIAMYSANKNKLRKEDARILAEPLSLNEQIKRKMTQVKAMGFREFVPFD